MLSRLLDIDFFGLFSRVIIMTFVQRSWDGWWRVGVTWQMGLIPVVGHWTLLHNQDDELVGTGLFVRVAVVSLSVGHVELIQRGVQLL